MADQQLFQLDPELALELTDVIPVQAAAGGHRLRGVDLASLRDLLELSQELSIGTGILSGTADRVLYEDSSNQLAESANLAFDGTTLTLGGTAGVVIPTGTTAQRINTEGRLRVNSTLGTTEIYRNASWRDLEAGGGGIITALNNRAENRLVTIGATTTELDGEANATFDGGTLWLQNDTDNAAVNLLTLSGNRATPTDGDEVTLSGDLSTDTGAQATFAQLAFEATDASNASKDGSIIARVQVADTLTDRFRTDSTHPIYASNALSPLCLTLESTDTGSDPTWGKAMLHMKNTTVRGPFIDWWAASNVRWGFGISSVGSFQFRPVTDASDPVDGTAVFTVDTNGDCDITGDLGSLVNLTMSGQFQITGNNAVYLNGTAGGAGGGIQYKDSGGGQRYLLHLPGSDVVAISNRASNGTVEIRANTSTAGGGGEVTVATFADTEVTFNSPTDSALNQAAVFIGNNRATPADNDTAYLSLQLDDSLGASTEFNRLAWCANDVTNTSKDSQFYISCQVADTLRGLLFVNPPTTTVTIDGFEDKIHLLVQGHSTQTTNIVEVEDSAGTDLVVIDGTGQLQVLSDQGTASLLLEGGGGNGGTMKLRNTTTTGYSGLNCYDNSDVLAFSFQYGNASAAVFADEAFFATRVADIEMVFLQGGVAAGNERIRLDASSNITLSNADVQVEDTLRFSAVSELTIATGAITVTKSYHTVDTQSDDSTDDLDTINGDTEGDILVLRAVNTARTVVIKNGTGNIVCNGGTDITLDDDAKTALLFRSGSNWRAILIA